MALIRIKHDDPNARISFAMDPEPDEKGGFLIDESDLVAIADHGWRVVHLDNDDEDAADMLERQELSERAAVKLKQSDIEHQLEAQRSAGAVDGAQRNMSQANLAGTDNPGQPALAEPPAPESDNDEHASTRRRGGSSRKQAEDGDGEGGDEGRKT